jgi:hypothetical protein
MSRRTSMIRLLGFLTVAALLGGRAAAQSLATAATITGGGWLHAPRAVVNDFDANGSADAVVASLGEIHYIPDVGLAPLPPLTAATRIVPNSALSGGAQSLHLGDFDGDGIQDVLVRGVGVGPGPGSPWNLLSGLGNGTFAVPTSWGLAGTSVYSVTMTGDFDANGTTDVCGWIRAGMTIPQAVEIMLSTGSGFIVSATVSGVLGPRVGDFDGDGFDDVVMGDQGPGTNGFVGSQLRILRGSPAGTVTPSIVVATPGLPARLHLPADYDGDGRDDLVLTVGPLTAQTNACVLFGNTAAPLSNSSSIGNPAFSSFRSADIDSDGFLDLLAERGIFTPASFFVRLSMLRGDGSGQFSMAQAQPLWDSPSSFGLVDPFEGPNLADFDGDGDVDWLASCPVPGAVNGVVIRNLARYGAGCAGTPGTPRAEVGKARPGNPTFVMSATQAVPLSPAILALSFAPAALSTCGILVDLNPGNLILPSATVGVTITDPSGTAALAFGIPAAASGIRVFGQWAVVDPLGGFAYAGTSFSLTEGRTVWIF